MRQIAAALVAAFTLPVSSWAEAQTLPRVAPLTQQSPRDAERIAILHTELQQEQQALDEATRRRAELLAAGDHKAADQADQARARNTDNIAALQRELKRAGATPPDTQPAAQAPHTPSHALPAAAAWWDVYARLRVDTASVVSEPSPPRRP